MTSSTIGLTGAPEPTQSVDAITIPRPEFQALLSAAAKQGAEEALKGVGLNGPTAYQDVIELRNLLESWRTAKSTAYMTVVRIVTTALLAALSLGAFLTFTNTK